MKKYFQIFIVLILTLAFKSYATESVTKTDQLYQSGLQAIERDDYETAISLLEQAVKADPTKADHHRWLARAYGLQVEHAPWYSQMGLAKKARASFEKAVEVEPENIDALLDLRSFYDQAPAIVGGSKEKAEVISKKLKLSGYDSDQK
ncbi:MAG: hypothetical protein AB8D52_05680 [Gammaproteobacteria bacterium]